MLSKLSELVDDLGLLVRQFLKIMVFVVCVWLFYNGVDLMVELIDRKDKPFALYEAMAQCFGVPCIVAYLERVRHYGRMQAIAAEQTREMLASIYGFKKPE